MNEEPLPYGPHSIRILHEDTYVVADGRFAAGVPGPPPHHHDWDEGFYVVSGSLSVTVDGATEQVDEGQFVVAPAGTVHTFEVSGTTPATLLATFGSPRAAGYLRAMSAAFGTTGSPDPVAMEDARKRFDVTVVVDS